jgi:hypothetical protein
MRADEHFPFQSDAVGAQCNTRDLYKAPKLQYNAPCTTDGTTLKSKFRYDSLNVGNTGRRLRDDISFFSSLSFVECYVCCCD